MPESLLSTREAAAKAARRIMRIHPLITKSEDLKALVDRLSQQPFIAVDTEFMRENTYWPDLCLVQVASPEEAAGIDPKADIDLKPLLDLFVNNRDVLKVFHAGGQDLEIIHNLTGKVPYPLFDTQIAAMALGHGEQIGYSNLIERAFLATASTRVRASPTGAGGRSTSARSITPSPTSPTSPRSSRAWSKS